MNTRDQGKKLAKNFGDEHEEFVGNPTNEKTMDLHNKDHIWGHIFGVRVKLNIAL